MNKVWRALVLSTCALICSFSAFAQDEIDEYLQGNVKEAEALLGAYVSPALKALSSGMNQGWYNTAKAHKLIGIDITISVNAMKVPDKELFFNPSSVLGPNSSIRQEVSSPSYPNAPTIFGPEGDENTPQFYLVDNNGERIPSSEFSGAPGVLDLKKQIGRTVVPVPTVNMGIGLPKGTDLKLRYMPSLDFGDGGAKMFGIGVMHDVKQWIPGIKNMPFDLSGFIGYTKMDFHVNFDEDHPDQKGELGISATTIQGVISKKISVLTVYGGAGYNIAKAKLAMKGSYEVGEEPATETWVDPVSIKTSASGPRVTAGFRLKLAILTLHADYTLQKYSCLTAGIGLSVR